MTATVNRRKSTVSERALVERLPAVLRSRRALAWALRFIDLAGIIFIYHVAFWVRNGDFTINLLHSQRWLVLTAVLMGSLYLFDTYRIDRHEPRWRLPVRLLAAAALSGATIGMLIYLLGPELIGHDYNVLGRFVLASSLALFVCWALASRLAARKDVERFAGLARWLIIASAGNQAMARFAIEFHANRTPGALVLLSSNGAPVAGMQAEGSLADLPVLLAESWSGAILADWDLPAETIQRLMQARLEGLRIYDLGDFYEQLWEKLPVQHLSHGWFMASGGFVLLHEPFVAKVKRACDIVFAVMFALIAMPVMLVVALAVLSNGGKPIFFSQARVGLAGKVFTCYKFRTMIANAEAVGGAQWAASKDPRITAVGRWLRRLRLDELPQLWNVLCGEMSFIGPRPERPEFTEKLENEIPYYGIRHLVRPGLTGWAQVNYPYGASVDDAREKLEYDLYYLKNHSLALDLVILLRTVRVVLFGTGAR